ncbi:MAG: hypothetical protein HY394_01210 [Candidatus Diapherotrites archaeon]|nr:hypothetical protein [Candidatus Diapherotrites archaeon]
MRAFGFDKKELAVFRRLDSAQKIQDFLDKKLSYNLEEKGETCYSPRLVLRHRKAHCFEGAAFAAAALAVHGHPPLLMDFRAVRDEDHVVAVYKINGLWGAIGQSKFSGLKYRDPVFASVRELAMSYFDHYFNLRGEKTLREFSAPVNLFRFGKAWLVSERPIGFLPDGVEKARHFKILPSAEQEKLLKSASRQRIKAEQAVVKQKK